MTLQQAIDYALEETSMPLSVAGLAETKARPELLRIFALGPARVEREGRALTPSDWTYAKPRELLFYLLSHPSRTREQIGVALWPDSSPAQLRGTFHTTLHQLRRVLGRQEWIFFEKGRYTFNRSLGYWFDVEAFEKELAEAQRLKAEEVPEQIINHLEEAVELYGGEFLEDFADAEWVLIRREELKQRYLEALLDLGRLLFGEGRYTEAAEAYQKSVAHDELLEAAHRGLMRCQVALGERGRALQHYQGLMELLNEELGATPAPETVALYERLRRGEQV